MAQSVEVPTAIHSAVTVGSDVDDPQIDTQDVSDFDYRLDDVDQVAYRNCPSRYTRSDSPWR
jgi:hypothetical protein